MQPRSRAGPSPARARVPVRSISPVSDDAFPRMHATTILMVRKGGRVVIGGDGQVSLGQTIVKGNAKKVRRLANGSVIGGVARAAAGAFTLFERLEGKLGPKPGHLTPPRAGLH